MGHKGSESEAERRGKGEWRGQEGRTGEGEVEGEAHMMGGTRDGSGRGGASKMCEDPQAGGMQAAPTRPPARCARVSAKQVAGFSSAFFDEYHKHRPRSSPHYDERQKLYELYHHLNVCSLSSRMTVVRASQAVNQERLR